MRFAVVSDIHGSLRALEAVVADLEGKSPDLIVHGGDLAVNGPRPAEVIDLVRELGWPGVLGNTDEMLEDPEGLSKQEARAPQLIDLLRVLFLHTAPATAQMLGEERIDWLKSLPMEWRNDDLVVVHASPGDLWRAPMPDADEESLSRVFESLNSRIVVYGHIHRAYIPHLPNFTLANSGSAGLSYDGDSRATYLLIEEGGASIQRVEYDLDREVSDLMTSGYPFASWLAEIRRTGKYRPPPSPVDSVLS
jgi:putative phosphoesterase